MSNEKHVAGQSGNGGRNNTYNFHSEIHRTIRSTGMERTELVLKAKQITYKYITDS